MTDPEDHPLIDKLFDGLTLGGKVGAELFVRGARGTKHAIERTLLLIEDVGTHLEKRLEEFDEPPQETPSHSAGKPHIPTEGENGVLSDKTFDFLDRPGADGEPPPPE